MSDLNAQAGQLRNKHRDYARKIVERIHVQDQLFGLREVTKQCLVALFTRKHVLLEGNPGLGKTDLAKAICRQLGFAIEKHYRRIQFTPDKLPQDLIGSEMPGRRGGQPDWTFHKGPIFTWLLLADEINRASPKTQAAMLEVMAEQAVTLPDGGRSLPAREERISLAGKSMDVHPPFFVIATQNPIDQEGTYDLPEAQADRFLFKIRMPSPSRGALFKIMEKTSGAGAFVQDARPVGAPPELPDALRIFAEIAGAEHKGDGAAYRRYEQLLPPGDNSLEVVQEHAANLVEASTMFDGRDRTPFLNAGRIPAERLEELARSYRALIGSLGRERFKRLAVWVAENIEYGLGPRAAIGLLSAVKAYSYLFEDFEDGAPSRGFPYVAGFPYTALARTVHPTLRHRVKFRTAAGLGDEPLRERLITEFFRLTAPDASGYLDLIEQFDGPPVVEKEPE
jgi:MoxR-like ATPase